MKINTAFCNLMLKKITFKLLSPINNNIYSRSKNSIYNISTSTGYTYLMRPSQYDQLQKRCFAIFRRQPISVTINDAKAKGKTLEEYADEQKAKTAPEDDIKVNFSTDISDELISDDSLSDIQQPSHEAIKHTHESLKFINFQLYEKVKGRYRTYLEKGKSAKHRYDQDVFLIEGWRLCAEALKVGLEPKAIFYSRSRLLGQMGSILNKEPREMAEFLNLYPLIKTPYKKLEIWSSLKTSPGLTAAFSISETKKVVESLNRKSIPTIVILDEVRDPSNLGSIIRTLVATGVEKIILMKGCCDLWDIKTLRASCGSHFKMPIETNVKWSTLTDSLGEDFSVYLAESEINSSEHSELNQDQEEETRLYELAVDASANQTSYYVDNEGNQIYVNESYHDEEHLENFNNIPLPFMSYDKANFYSQDKHGVQSPAILVIGGETGISPSANKFVLENHGTKIFIPMLNDVESLNSSVATGILSYEMLRQFRRLKENV